MNEGLETLTQLAFRALADPSRRAMICLLANKPMSIAELCHSFEMTRTAVRKHVRVLEEGAIVELAPQGRERMIRLRPEGMRVVSQWLQTVPQAVPA
ncbi:MAG: ArsR/SmtB family transcription factor [Shimia sp.]